ncbi:carbamoyl-phosphate synthase subunit L [Pollutimonas subterranea]|uniref:Carbamoyl-phosphate synthase subunit L n=1 Tax=Pollutimonas subterranea TaxID=2045210 RepID=A0A2N4U942_9BURK|nr:biotin carboxylase N-terminal domain-containing protein [Pollutimonas subterranea]PLC51542.1 carbamoyl-phosphate synthase subunit L [Pollutimonas subterranea]
MFRRILIANRGEIACRIARTCRDLGIEFVAVYSSADAGALHLKGAVARVCVGGGPATDSYLKGDAIIAAALQHGCEAIHPGYGFLSENADFAQAVQDAGLVFIGPRAQTISALGDKSRAKSLMRDAGVPTVPGMVEASEDPAQIERMIHEIGLPVLLKPSAGGGGKGMQVLLSLNDLRPAVVAAIRVARSSFGDGRLIVERFVERPRHVEVQVFGDQQGNVVHLYERECTLQRRHQKVVEEAPAIALPEAVRKQLHDAAVRGAFSIGYVNAGTFEFIVDQDHNFYFLEVNTRLQVEHPVTEEITGLDLVAWQFRVAAGDPLPLAQSQIKALGCAIECRLYAEDPAEGFRPAPGRVARVEWPKDARVEAGIAAGDSVPAFYDPMVAKLVVRGENRVQALAHMHEALKSTVLLGLTTNLGFLTRVLEDPKVHSGQIHTQYLDDSKELHKPDSNIAAAVACAASLFSVSGESYSSWTASGKEGVLDRESLSTVAPLGTLSFWAGDRLIRANLSGLQDGQLSLCVDGEAFEVSVSSSGNEVIRGSINGRPWAACDTGTAIELQVSGSRYTVQRARSRRPGEVKAAGAAVAPMPGIVAALPVEIGNVVAEGDVLAVVEAMKMENQVLASAAGLVTAIHYSVGANVNVGDLLVEVDVDDSRARSESIE